MTAWTDGAAILAHAGNAAPSAADSAYAELCAAAVNDGIDLRLAGVLIVEPPLPAVTAELTPRFPVRPGSPVLVHVIADSLADITGLTATFNGQPLTLDAFGRAGIPTTVTAE